MRIRQHVNPLRSEYLEIALPTLNLVENWPIEVELGSAEAHFLIERAQEAPQQNYLGIEIRRELVIQTNQVCRARGLPQVQSVYANMSVDLPKLFAPGQVHRFFINFPDPWWKTWQHKRRVVSEALFDVLHSLLCAGGELHIATDIFEIALDAMAALEAESPQRFSNLYKSWSFLPQSRFLARSRRERHCELEGIRIWRLAYQRN
jgi:tRNA (guanine-N7-)-methyltransferase